MTLTVGALIAEAPVLDFALLQNGRQGESTDL